MVLCLPTVCVCAIAVGLLPLQSHLPHLFCYFMVSLPHLISGILLLPYLPSEDIALLRLTSVVMVKATSRIMATTLLALSLMIEPLYRPLLSNGLSSLDIRGARWSP